MSGFIQLPELYIVLLDSQFSGLLQYLIQTLKENLVIR
jgi:hypothetical protein